MTCRSLAPAVLALAVAACFAGENPASGGDAALAAAREQVTQRLNAYMQIPTTGNVEAIPDFWTPDGKIYEAGVALAAAELPPFARQFFAGNTLTDVKMTPIETIAHDGGNSVYVFGNSSETVQAKDGKTPPSTVRCHFLIRWVKGADGEYRMQHFVAVPVPQNS